MSGGSVAYNLRPNKFVERQLFVELLNSFCKKPQEQYVYVSMGGPQLEDHRLLHNRLGFTHLISLESNEVVYQRQQFNLRPGYIKCLKSTTGEFIDNYIDLIADEHVDKKFIVWLDYASPRQRYVQLMEFQTLLSKLQVGDIVKITMNANPSTLGEKRRGESDEDAQRLRTEKLQDQIGDFLQGCKLSPDKMTSHRIIPVFCHAIMKASVTAVKDNPRIEIVPLSIFVYKDGYHQMLTITVTIVQKSDANELREDIGKYWDYLPEDWTDFTRINVPNLTPKERLYIEGKLFSDDIAAIHNELEFRFDHDQEESLRVLEEYARHYRRYPSYFQVVL